jgi:hypothetical protein
MMISPTSLSQGVLGPGQDVCGTTKRPSGRVESGKEAISGRLDLMAPLAAKAGPDHRVVAIGEPGPLPWPDPGLVLGRGHDVGEEDDFLAASRGAARWTALQSL